MKKIPHYLIVASTIVSAIVATSCDNEYDLSKDIDTNINIGKNFSVPVGKTVEIPVSRIIKPGENIKESETGTLVIEADGSFSSDIAKIEPFKINGLYPQFEDFPYSGLPQSGAISQDIDVPVKTYATYTLEDTRTELPSEVEAVYLAVFNGENGASSHVNISIPAISNGSLTGINSVTLKNVTVTFPDIFILNDGTHSAVYPEIILNAANKFSFDVPITISRMELPADRQSEYISEPQANGKRVFTLNKQIEFTADAIINLTPSQVNQSDIHFIFEYSIAESNVTEINGIMTPEVSVDETLAINDIPEFLSDKTSTFIPNDISFNLEMSNDLGMSLMTSLLITPWDNEKNSPLGGSVSIPLEGDNAIKPNSTTKYLISNEARSTDAGIINIVCPELTTLLNTIPDSYKITTGTVVADGINGNGYTLGNSYHIAGAYSVNVPFSFSGMTINYTDYIDNLYNDLEDCADLTDKIILNFDAVSTIPAELEAVVELYNMNGNKLNEITVTGTAENMIKINASTDGKEAVTPITITLEEAEGSTQLEELEKIVYTIKAANPVGEDVVIKSSQYIILKNGIAKIPNGITTEL